MGYFYSQRRYLIFSVFYLLKTICFIEYNEDEFDAHPYSFGQLDFSYNAHSVCKSHDTRLCTDRDLRILVKQGRFGCDNSWALKRSRNKILPYTILNKKRKCILKTEYVGIIPTEREVDLPNVFICKLKSQNVTFDDCTGTGTDYTGYLSTTEDGDKCQIWTKSYPNKHDLKVAPADWNFCRNVGANKSKPWCFLAEKEGWGYCNLRCRDYGPFDKCNAVLYPDREFGGSSCTIKTGAGRTKFIRYPCKYMFLFRSIKINGKMCRLEFRRAEDTHSIVVNSGEEIPYLGVGLSSVNFYGYALSDISPDVQLIPKSQYDYRYSFFYKYCSSEDVDRAEFLNDLTDNSRLGNVDGKTVYTYGMYKNMPKKNSYCCVDNKVEWTPDEVFLDEAKSRCERNYREEVFEYRGKAITYRFRKRLCTNAELYRNVLQYGLDPPKCFVEYSKRFVYCTGGHSNVARHQACCCEKGCFKIEMPCSENENCCTEFCWKGKCVDEDLYNFDDEGVGEEKLSAATKILIVLVSLFVLSHLLACLFPRRKLRSDVVKLHLE